MVKSTYVLDLATADSLERLAHEWGVSKSEALRRAIRSAAAAGEPNRLTVFRQLQDAVKLSRTQAASWAETVKAERQAPRPARRRRT